jgi:magnesium-transporting ATPase (P-type)
MTQQPPPPLPVPQQPAYPPPPPQAPYNTYAILAIVLAILVLPPLGIYFGHVAKREIAVSGERGIELAQAAIVVGWVLTALFGVFLLVFCAFFIIWLGAFGAIFGSAPTSGGY